MTAPEFIFEVIWEPNLHLSEGSSRRPLYFYR